MARKAEEFTASYGRDAGRKYLLTEMPASKGEMWAIRVINGLATSGVELQGVSPEMGWSGLAVIGADAIARMPMHLAEPLLAEMFNCIQRVQPTGEPRGLIEDDIEEIATRMELRERVVSLHLGFSLREKLSTLAASFQTTQATSSPPGTSPPASDT